jgi:hypothetical protein
MRALSLLPLALLAGCASITHGTSQSIAVDSNPRGASCTLNNGNGTYYIKETPASVTVQRSASALTVTCDKDGGYHGAATSDSHTKAMAFGNIIAGGIIGGAVDAGTGAAYDYPPSVFVNLTKDEPEQPSK